MPDEQPPLDVSTSRADQQLPPVSPPSSQFVMQLFVIPLTIVSMIVGVYLLFEWVANRDMRPAQLADDIERLNHGSWQKALTLANQLRDDRNAELRQDRELCTRLAEQLTKRVKEGGRDQDRVRLRIYLCRALGDFDLNLGFPALIEAADHQDHLSDLEVRRAASQAIWFLVDRLGAPTDQAELRTVMVRAAQTMPTGEAGDDESKLRFDRLRGTAAMVLGYLDGEDADSTLVAMLDDPSGDVRYNAVSALARKGNERCLPGLVEMLSGDVTETTPEGLMLSDAERQEWAKLKQGLVVNTALRSAKLLLDSQPEFDLSTLEEALKDLSETGASIGADVPDTAAQLLELMGATPKPQPSAARDPNPQTQG